MIILAIIHIAKGNGETGKPTIANINGVPNLFGVSVYSFMCQHSLPSLVTPIKNKRSLSKLLAADYFLILLFYMLLGMTAIYCFPSGVLQDIYTLNFQVNLISVFFSLDYIFYAADDDFRSLFLLGVVHKKCPRKIFPISSKCPSLLNLSHPYHHPPLSCPG